MLDGAALGTLIIGLDSARMASEWPQASTDRSARRFRPAAPAFRSRLAIALRFAADRLDRTPSRALGSRSSAA